MVNLNELRKLTFKDVLAKYTELDKQIAMEQFNVSARKTNKTAQLRGMKKDLARIATVLTELKIIKQMQA